MEKIPTKDIHKGDILWESAQYGSWEIEVLTEPTHIDGQWKFTGRTVEDDNMEFLITDGYEHYGPKFTTFPWYDPFHTLDGRKLEMHEVFGMKPPEALPSNNDLGGDTGTLPSEVNGEK